MLRRNFLRLSVLTPLASLSWRTNASLRVAGSYTEQAPNGQPRLFELRARNFMLDGQPFQIRSGEMHPVRIPADYWRHRIRMAKAMGLNTIALYLMWNALEPSPGVFDLDSAQNDFVRFIHLCAEEGMWVYMRPGPYVCAEWDFGGLPPYLLRDPQSRVRNVADAGYMAAVSRYLDAIAPRIAPLMAGRGGPILMLQIENEYASFGQDLSYLKKLQHLWQERGIHGPFSISDGLAQITKTKTYLPGAALGLDGDTDFESAQAIAGEMPVWMGEGYPGWLTHWGDRDFARGDFVDTLRGLLRQRRSFNLYVVHGGTNFGFGAGANAKADGSDFEPVITSYDYGAPIDERGLPTGDYHRFRGLIAASTGIRPPAIPEAPPTIGFAPVLATPYASLWDNLTPDRVAVYPQANETLLAQDHGLVLYRKQLRRGGALAITGLRDYGTVFGAGRYLGFFSRVHKPGLNESEQLPVPAPAQGESAELAILVDSFGHVGYGQAMLDDRKGIVGAITLDGQALGDWQVHGFALDAAWLAGLSPLRAPSRRPGLFFRAEIELDRTGDCYLDMRAWDKGYLWVNGHLLGRYWRIGPQQRLYCPASWLRPGRNSVLVFDLHRLEPTLISASEHLHD